MECVTLQAIRAALLHKVVGMCINLDLPSLLDTLTSIMWSIAHCQEYNQPGGGSVSSHPVLTYLQGKPESRIILCGLCCNRNIEVEKRECDHWVM